MMSGSNNSLVRALNKLVSLTRACKPAEPKVLTMPAHSEKVHKNKKQIKRLIARSEGRICVSYRQPVVERKPVAAAPILHKIGRRTAKIAAGAFSASLSISTPT